MAMAPDVASSTDPNPIEDEGQHIDAPGLQYFVFGLFFIFGGITHVVLDTVFTWVKRRI